VILISYNCSRFEFLPLINNPIICALIPESRRYLSNRRERLHSRQGHSILATNELSSKVLGISFAGLLIRIPSRHRITLAPCFAQLTRALIYPVGPVIRSLNRESDTRPSNFSSPRRWSRVVWNNKADSTGGAQIRFDGIRIILLDCATFRRPRLSVPARTMVGTRLIPFAKHARN